MSGLALAQPNVRSAVLFANGGGCWLRNAMMEFRIKCVPNALADLAAAIMAWKCVSQGRIHIPVHVIHVVKIRQLERLGLSLRMNACVFLRTKTEIAQADALKAK
jgi:hypothetical protein